MSTYPYTGRFDVNASLPQRGRSHGELLRLLRAMAEEEDARWEGGQCSGTIYCGDHEHYQFLNEVFGLYSHMNALQRDMCPSATKFEGEILAMTMDILGGRGIEGTQPGGLVTSGGTASILHAMLAYRDHAAKTRNVTRPNLVKPQTAHPAFDKAGHLFGIEVRTAPVDPETTLVDLDWMRSHIDQDTIVLVGSACNYGYGTVDPISQLSEIALEHEVGLHVDGCLGGFILPFGRELGYDIPAFDFDVPGVTSISADTHKYGYALKGGSTVLFRDKGVRNAQYFCLPGWSGGKYMSPGMDGSRSAGLLASTWASLMALGREGYLARAEQIFGVSKSLQEVVHAHPELRILGKPTFLFAFTSDVIDIYHVNDALNDRGWRLNGLQYPNALHLATTGPQTQPNIVDRFADDLENAVAYAKDHAGQAPISGSIYGGVAGGLTDQADEFIRMFMAQMLDEYQSVPEPVT